VNDDTVSLVNGDGSNFFAVKTDKWTLDKSEQVYWKCDYSIDTWNLPAKQLNALRVDNLATRKAGIEMHLGLLATVEDNTLALSNNIDVGSNASQDIHSLLLVTNGNSDGTSVSGLVFNLPLVTVGVEGILGSSLGLQNKNNIVKIHE
jgi:hypothetical protein